MRTDGSAGASSQVGKLGREEEAVLAGDVVAPTIVLFVCLMLR